MIVLLCYSDCVWVCLVLVVCLFGVLFSWLVSRLGCVLTVLCCDASLFVFILLHYDFVGFGAFGFWCLLVAYGLRRLLGFGLLLVV